MMKKIKIVLLLLSALFLTNNSSCQTTQAVKFNFDVEKISNGIPEQWTAFGEDGYTLRCDSSNSNRGNHSLLIQCTSNELSNYGAYYLPIPNNYEGKQITLTGYIKTENVTEGYAGLWMRIDPSVAFDHMGNRGVVGTTDWTKYEITLNLNPSKTTQIVVGGLLTGEGKMWLDNLSVTIDGKDIQNLKPIAEKEYPAQKDKEFDQGSKISEIPINKESIKTLKELGLIWGFLKYYHPAIAEGNYNWDYELFRIVPKILNEKNRSQRDRRIVEWIHNLGQITEETTPFHPKNEVKIEPDLGWIASSGFSKELITTLNNVKTAKRTDTNYYVAITPGIGNPIFQNEREYANMKYPDAGYRLLSLYRYWNTIQYYFPYKNLIEEDWKNVLEEFVPRFIKASNQTEYVLTTLEMIGRIHDTHANIWGNNQTVNHHNGLFYAAPILSFVENKAVVMGFWDKGLGEKTGLKIGDVITEINGKTVENIVRERLQLTPASNYPTQLRNIGSNLLRTNDSTMNVIYSREKQFGKTTLTTHKEIFKYDAFAPDSSFKRLDGNIAYLYPGLLKNGEMNKLWNDYKETKGLIIDLRCYPSEFIVFSLGARLLPRTTPFVKFSSGTIHTPGLFMIGENTSIGCDNPNFYKGKVILLINEETQSQAEYTTMALRTAPNATVIGSTTAGADGNVSRVILPGGIATMISGIGVYYPDGKETQRVGIIPDIELKPTIKGIIEGRDELLERAIDLISKFKTNK